MHIHDYFTCIDKKSILESKKFHKRQKSTVDKEMKGKRSQLKDIVQQIEMYEQFRVSEEIDSHVSQHLNLFFILARLMCAKFNCI